MDSNQKMDLSLTGISIELLGNKIYGINGKRQNELINLFEALPESRRKNRAYRDLDTRIIEFMNEQFDLILQEANQTLAGSEIFVSLLSDLKFNQETNLLRQKLNETRMQIMKQAMRSNSDKTVIINQYYECEKNDLIEASMQTLRLLKYIINDEELTSHPVDHLIF